MKLKMSSLLAALALTFIVGTVPAKADTVLCPAAANQNGFGGVYTNVTGNGSCSPNTAVQLYIPTDTDYARLEWTGTGLTLGSIGVTNATVTFTAVAAGDQPYYMMTFQDSGDVLGAPVGDQMLMLEFQTSTVSGNSMLLDPSATLFNIYDNTTSTYFLGGQSNAHPLDYWLALYPALTSYAITGFRIGEGLAGGSCGSCSETLVIDSVDVAAPPKPVASDTSYYITYYGNANTAGFPDAQVNILNPGSTGGWSVTDGYTAGAPGVGDLCANIYVFTSDQEMVECCSCFISPNGLLQLSLDVNLTANPLANSAVVPLPVAGAVKIVSSNTTSDQCRSPFSGGNGSVRFDIAASTYTQNGVLRGWNTHVRETLATPQWTVTETPLRVGSLSSDGSELQKLQAQCYALQDLGSGKGRCTCPTGAN
jgi:hypothetical protein